MNLSTEEKENIKTYFLIKEGVEISEVTEFYDYLLLKPYGVIHFEDKIYTNKKIQQNMSLFNKNINDISPLQNLTNLKVLNLNYNNLTDISPISTLFNLTHLYIGHNNISDISPIYRLYGLLILYMHSNKIKDISTIYRLTNLRYLYMWSNNTSEEQIKDLKSKLPNCNIQA